MLNREYRLSQGREHQAIVGLSMGGGQSLQIGLDHLNQFAWVGGFSSAAPLEPLNEEFAHLIQDGDYTNTRLRLLWIGCGQDDFLLERNQHFITWLNQHNIQHTWHLTEGGHEWTVWRRYLAEFLPLLFR